MTTVNIKKFLGDVQREVIFKAETKDADGCQFYAASTSNFSVMNDQPKGNGVLIAFGPDAIEDPESGISSNFFAFSADDDKKLIAKQLRELADWFEKQ